MSNGINDKWLEERGFVKGANGEWSKPQKGSVAVRAVAADSAKRDQGSSLDKGDGIKKSRAKSVDAGAARVSRRVQMTMYRRRLLDPDAVAYSMKPLTDSIAMTLGVDDADPSVEWEWSQVKTTGDEGVVVRISEA